MKAHTYGHGAPSFPTDWEISRRDVLQFTDLKQNNNKYYGMEIHVGRDGAKQRYRIFTHYGRTDDLERDPASGAKEVRHFPTVQEAQACYQLIYNEKTGPAKGYRPVHLHASNIGSEKARGSIAASDEAPPAVHAPSTLDPEVQALVEYIYSEATSALTSSISAKITSRGIDTPLGILTLKQIEKGEAVLMELYQAIMQGAAWSRFEQLSGEFYTIIPHRIGKSKQDTKASVISTLKQFEEKLELLQLMKDMIQVNESGQVLFSSGVDMKYRALRATIKPLKGYEFENRKEWVLSQQVKSQNIDIINIFSIQRDVEHKAFHSPGNERLLFHGSRISNWVGLLSRGLLMPKVVVSMGGGRTDVGMLGNGIYFGSAACTSAQYTTGGQKGSRFMLVCNVGLGNIKDYTQITKGLTEPPHGYNSVHGVRRTPYQQTEFEDDEYVIFNTRQQRQEYLVEFVLSPQERARVQQWSPASLPSISSSSLVPAPAPHSHSHAHAHPPHAPAHHGHAHAHPGTSMAAPPQAHAAPAHHVTSKKPSSHPAQVAPISNKSHSHTTPVASSSGSGGDPANSMTPEQRSTKEQEDTFRRMFASERNNSALADPYLLCKDVFSARNEFMSQAPQANEGPFLFRPSARTPGPAIVDKDQFTSNWDKFTGGQLRGLNWNGVFAAGGSVLCCLSSASQFTVENNKSSDVDLFLYAMSEDDATAKLQHIYAVVQQNTGSRSEIVRAKHAVTILGQYPARHIQIVLRIYKSPAEVLMGFDVDCCCVGFDGKKAYALPRAQRAITKGYNLVDLSRRSLTYEVRLFKYAKRGFQVALPGHDASRVDPNVYNATLKDAKGLTKLLLLERMHTQGGGVGFGGPKKGPMRRRGGLKKKKAGDEFNEDAKYEAEAQKGDASDYNLDVFIPWGPHWMPFNILKQLDGRDKANFYIQMKKAPGTQQHNHIFVSGLQGVLSGVSSTCQLCKISPVASYSNTDDGFVRGPLNWLTENPGRQLLTGSFHPVDDQNWDAGVYGAGGASAPSGFGAPTSASTFFPPPTTPASSGLGFGGAPKPSAFMYFAQEQRKHLPAGNFGDTAKNIAIAWQALPPHEKQRYEQLSQSGVPLASMTQGATKAFGGFKKKGSAGSDSDGSGSDDDGSDDEEGEMPIKKGVPKAKAGTKAFGGFKKAANVSDDDDSEDEDEDAPKAKSKAKSPAKKAATPKKATNLFGAQTSGGFGAAAPSSGFGAKSSTSFGAAAPSGGFGAKSSSGFGAAAPSSGFGAQPSSGFGGQPSSGFGAQPSGGFGTAAPSAGFGAAAPSSGFGAQPSAGFGAKPSTGFGAAAPSGGFGAPSGGFGAQPSTGFGAQPSGGFGAKPSSGFGAAAPSSGFGVEPGSPVKAHSGFGAQPSGGFGAASPNMFGVSPAKVNTSFGTQPAATGFGAQPSSGFGAASPSTFGASPAKAKNSDAQQQLASALTSQFGGPTAAPVDSDDLSRFGGGHGLAVFGETPAAAPATPQAAAFGGSSSKLAVFGESSPAPQPAGRAPSFSAQQQLPSSFAPAASDADSGIKDAFKAVEPPKSPVAKLLLLISMLHKGGRISDVQKDQIKDLVINGDKSVICALEVFEVERDFDELTDTLQRILKCTYPASLLHDSLAYLSLQ